MIPVAPVSFWFLLLLIAGPIALFCVLVWWVLLAIQPRRRLRFRQGPWIRLAGMGVLTAIGGCFLVLQWSLYDWRQERLAEQASRQHTLSQETRLAGVWMPAGTHLELNVWGDPDSVAWARFPHPVALGEAPVISLERPRPDLPDASWRVRLATDSWIEGWHCDAHDTVEMQTASDHDRGFRLESCTLAGGNAVRGWSPLASGTNRDQVQERSFELPAGATVQAVVGGSVYTNGEHDADRWRVRIERDGLRLPVFGLTLEQAYLAVDEQRRLLYVSHARLAEPATVGGQAYAAGTEVSTPNYRLHPAWPMALQMQNTEGHLSETEKSIAVRRIHDLVTGEWLSDL